MSAATTQKKKPDLRERASEDERHLIIGLKSTFVLCRIYIALEPVEIEEISSLRGELLRMSELFVKGWKTNKKSLGKLKSIHTG